jgi:hypothetical protein
MGAYADTSFLGSYYLPDANTPAALACARALGTPMVFTALHRLELRNALALAVFQRRVTAVQTQAVWQDVTNDLRAGLLAVTPLRWYALLRQAAQLSTRHTPQTGCRSLDILHVAAANAQPKPSSRFPYCSWLS